MYIKIFILNDLLCIIILKDKDSVLTKPQSFAICKDNLQNNFIVTKILNYITYFFSDYDNCKLHLSKEFINRIALNGLFKAKNFSRLKVLEFPFKNSHLIVLKINPAEHILTFQTYTLSIDLENFSFLAV